jgi:hypothetical protein
MTLKKKLYNLLEHMKINKSIVLNVLVTVNDGKIERNKYIAR